MQCIIKFYITSGTACQDNSAPILSAILELPATQNLERHFCIFAGRTDEPLMARLRTLPRVATMKCRISIDVSVILVLRNFRFPIVDLWRSPQSTSFVPKSSDLFDMYLGSDQCVRVVLATRKGRFWVSSVSKCYMNPDRTFTILLEPNQLTDIRVCGPFSSGNSNIVTNHYIAWVYTSPSIIPFQLVNSC